MRTLFAAFTMLFTLSGAGSSAAVPAAFAGAHRPVSTANPVAQQRFDEGLTLLYAFNPEEARRRFERALRADPNLAMAQWGIALSFGININTNFEPAQQRLGRQAIERAVAIQAGAGDVERALIAAAVQRYASLDNAERSADAYRDAMDALAKRFPDDADVLTLAAESMLDAQHWDYRDGQPTGDTRSIINRLRAALALAPGHIGADHLLIHVVAISPRPSDALESADRLAAASFEPAAEHLIHMPSHLYLAVGDYHRAALASQRAVDAFHSYLRGDHARGHELYIQHDLTFAVFSYMMAGEYRPARRLTREIDGDQTGPAANTVLVRFRRWNDIDSQKASAFDAGMRAAALGDFDRANKALRTVHGAQDPTNTVSREVLQAAIARVYGDQPAELSALRRAVAAQDKLGRSEPPSFFFPVRESLGGALLRAAQYTEAERTFREDLIRNPDNPRSLFGLARALDRLGNVEAADAERNFKSAWAHADVLLDIRDL